MGLALSTFLLALACGGANMAWAQDNNAAQQTPLKASGWSLRCDAVGQGLACKATQAIRLSNTNQLLLSVSVTAPPGGGNPGLLVQLPHRISNQAGVTISTDDGPAETLQIQTCDTEGCYVAESMGADGVAAMRGGNRMLVVFQDLNKQKITVPVPLQGFTAVYNKL
jgi:invasion protein IalB